MFKYMQKALLPKNRFGTRMIVAMIFISVASPLWAQIKPGSVASAQDHVLQVYFFLLVFATIINRIVEYIKLFFQWIWPKIPFLQKIGFAVWKMVKKKLERLPLEYDEQKMRDQVNRIIITLILQVSAFLIGIAICRGFKIDMLEALNVNLQSPTLRYVFSGLLAGAGIGPIHSVFRMANEKRKLKELKTIVSGGQV